MSRLSSDELAPDGAIFNGFDYNVQVWVLGGVVQPCGHPDSMGSECCNGRVYAGMRINQIINHEVRRSGQQGGENANKPRSKIASSLKAYF